MSPSIVDLDGGLACEAARLRGVLAHSDLRNTYLALGAPYLAEQLLAESGRYSVETAKRLDDLVATLPTYSPVGLVGRLRPLAELPSVCRERLKTALEEAFESSFCAEQLAKELRARIGSFLEAQGAFIEAARQAEGLSEEHERSQLEVPHRALCSSARDLLERLEELPRGVWVP